MKAARCERRLPILDEYKRERLDERFFNAWYLSLLDEGETFDSGLPAVWNSFQYQMQKLRFGNIPRPIDSRIDLQVGFSHGQNQDERW
jgi:hypothetical protein